MNFEAASADHESLKPQVVKLRRYLNQDAIKKAKTKCIAQGTEIQTTSATSKVNLQTNSRLSVEEESVCIEKMSLIDFNRGYQQGF